MKLQKTPAHFPPYTSRAIKNLGDPRVIGDCIVAGADKAAQATVQFAEATSQHLKDATLASWHAGGQFVAGAAPLAGAASLVQGGMYAADKTNPQRWVAAAGALLNLAGTAALIPNPALGCGLLGTAGLIASYLKPEDCFGTDWAKGSVPLAGMYRNLLCREDDGNLLTIGGAVLSLTLGSTAALVAVQNCGSPGAAATALAAFSICGALSALDRVPPSHQQ